MQQKCCNSSVFMLLPNTYSRHTRANAAAKWPHRWSQLLTTEHNRQVDFLASKPKVLKGKRHAEYKCRARHIPSLVTKQAWLSHYREVMNLCSSQARSVRWLECPIAWRSQVWQLMWVQWKWFKSPLALVTGLKTPTNCIKCHFFLTRISVFSTSTR